MPRGKKTSKIIQVGDDSSDETATGTPIKRQGLLPGFSGLGRDGKSYSVRVGRNSNCGRWRLVARTGCSGCAGVCFGSAWGLATRAFKVQNCYLGEPDEEIERLYRWRSILGFIIIVCIEAYYHSLRTGVSHAYASVNDSVDALVRVVLIGGALIPVGVALLTRPGYRMVALRQLRFPAVAVGGYVALYLALSLALPLLLTARSAQGFLASLLALAVIVWLGIFMLRGLYLLIIGMFRLADGHPLLAPVAGTFIAWGVAFDAVLAGGRSSVPPNVAAVLLLGGPISVTAISSLEVARLRRKYPDDFPFRRGPLRSAASSSR
jgi:hypothetical protein